MIALLLHVMVQKQEKYFLLRLLLIAKANITKYLMYDDIERDGFSFLKNISQKNIRTNDIHSQTEKVFFRDVESSDICCKAWEIYLLLIQNFHVI